MSDGISFFVAGLPKPQPRVRAFLRKGAKHASVYDPGTAKHWRNLITWAAKTKKPKNPFVSPVRLILEFWLPSKEASGRWHGSRPDLSNLIKAVEDALNDSGIWSDDALVAHLDATKHYCSPGKPSGVQIYVTPCVY